MNAEQIVRDLAECDEPLDSEYGDCVLCYSERDHHESSCPWRRARELTARQDAEKEYRELSS